ncbi:hypothetical protein [Microbulbifer epialgicus]|uniref:Phage metallopeptidase domain-containing protein n=1 Tax=Microbulbifer epialgicus TaxID=393907 RepID=A0ABV4P6H5_9GAMM
MLGLPEADYDVRFASTREIEAATKGQPAWGTVTKEDGRWTILMEKSLSTKMGSTRFTQILAEELVHVEQLSTGYYKRLDANVRRYALETEATGWVIQHSAALGLRGSAFREFKKIHNTWESKWEKVAY